MTARLLKCGKQRNLSMTNQRGFSMIEALIAFAVLAFGVMGVVTLLATSKSAQFETVQRMRAVTLANSLVERIRINPLGITAYHTGLSSAIGDGNSPGSAPSEPSPDCLSAICTPAELAAHDLWEWEMDLRGAAVVDAIAATSGGLKEPQACVVFTPDTGPPARLRTGELRVIIAWRGLESVADDPAGTGTTCGSITSGDGVFRRQVVVETYVIDEGEI